MLSIMIPAFVLKNSESAGYQVDMIGSVSSLLGIGTSVQSRNYPQRHVGYHITGLPRIYRFYPTRVL